MSPRTALINQVHFCTDAWQWPSHEMSH